MFITSVCVCYVPAITKPHPSFAFSRSSVEIASVTCSSNAVLNALTGARLKRSNEVRGNGCKTLTSDIENKL